MKIDNALTTQIDKAISAYTKDRDINVKGAAVSVRISDSITDNKTYEGTKASFADIQDKMKAMDTEGTIDSMVLMSHSMSKEDYAKAMKDGEDLSDVDAKDMVTIVDRIKLAVAKGGTEVEGFTDDISKEAMVEMTGCSELPAALEEADLTPSKNDLKEIKEAADLAKEIDKITDGMKKYLLFGNRKLTIDNLYLAQHSATLEARNQGSGYFTVDSTGYLAKKADLNENSLKEEITNLLSNLELPADEATIKDSEWLIKNGMCVTKENLDSLKDMEKVSLPLSDKDFANAVTISLSEGKAPKDANVIKVKNIYKEALELTDKKAYLADSELFTRHLKLHENRLKMLCNANLTLLKAPIKISFEDEIKYVEALKKVAETPAYKEAEEVLVCQEKIEAVKTAPAAIIPSFAFKISEISISEIAETGEDFTKRFKAANMAYEEMFTPVRKDMGDSIKKAFRNVDELLESLGLEPTEENRRAVRILGYNSMPIEKKNLEQVREADRELNSVLTRLTPKDTLTLIRKGTSPIDMSIKELNEYLDAKENSKQEEMEKYSRFLYKLERNNEIAPEEREKYIEVYRFINHLEKNDYAAVGNVLFAGNDYTIKNLRTAIKTAKNIDFDVKSVGIYKDLVDEDINAPGQRDWISFKYNNLQETLNSPSEFAKELTQNNIPVTAANLEAVLSLKGKRKNPFEKAFESSEKEEIEEALSFTDHMEDSDTAKEGYNEIVTKLSDNVFNRAMNENTFIDVRELQLTHMQLTISSKLASVENYEIPVEIGNENTLVNVKIIHNSKEEPNALVSFYSQDLGNVSARLSFDNEKLTGYITCDLKEAVSKLEKVADKLGEGVKVVSVNRNATPGYRIQSPMKDNEKEIDSKQLYRAAMNFLAAMKGI